MTLQRPPAIRPGNRIAVIAPASAPLDPERLGAGLDRLRMQGFEVEGPRADLSHEGYLAGSDAVRLEELNGWIRRSDVDALWCVRGGYGTLRLLQNLDYDAARAHPKILIGYSDITALHLALLHRAGWPGLSGPMLGVEWSNLDDPFVDEALGYLAGSIPEPPMEEWESLECLVPGSASGTLIGGNLSMIARLVGTPYLPDLTGAILFLEDVGEPPYRVDGLLAQLRLSGHLEGLAGAVLAGFTEAEPRAGRPSLSMDDVFGEYFGRATYPVISGLAYGHFPDKRTMPIGVKARIESGSEACSLRVLEPITG